MLQFGFDIFLAREHKDLVIWSQFFAIIKVPLKFKSSYFR
jgi:hypothetical protein